MTRWLLTTLLILCTIPAHAAPAFNTVSALTVFDASNRVVGAAFGVPTGPMIVFEIDGRLIPLFVTALGFLGTAPLYFESVDCTGQGFMGLSLGMTIDATVGAPGRTIYLPSSTAPTQTIFARSAVNGTPGLSTSCGPPHFLFPGGLTVNGASPAVAIIDLNTRFTPPLSLRPVGIVSLSGAPALSTWAQILLVGLLLASGAWFLRQKRSGSAALHLLP